MKLTRAVTYLHLCAVNDAKVAILDAVAAEYMAVCQRYVTVFGTEAEPNGCAYPCFHSLLSQRWQRIAIQQAAGIARSWRSNHQYAHEESADTFAVWHEEEHAAAEEPPVWKQRQTSTLRTLVIQANANVSPLQPSQDTSFVYWLRISTLEPRQTIFLPVQLAAYHERCLTGKRVDSSVTLTRKADGWWVTLTYEEEVLLQTSPDAPVVGVDVGISHFLTTSTGNYYGSFKGRLAKRHQRDRAKRRRKAKLRACLKKKSVERLNSTRSPNRGVRATPVKSAYSSQECPRCHFVDRGNRPEQQSFCCGACGWEAHADQNAVVNIAARLGDREIQTTRTRQELKALLDARHQRWRYETGWS